MKKIFVFFSLLLTFYSFSQNEKVEIYPSNWWVGMKWNKVQLMVHSEGIKGTVMSIDINYPGVKLEKVNWVDSKNYVFLDLNIYSSARQGILKIKFNRINMQPLWYDFELKERRKGNGIAFAQGV